MWKYLVYLQESRRERAEAIREREFEERSEALERHEAFALKHKKKITAGAIILKAIAFFIVFPALVIRGGFPTDPLALAGLVVLSLGLFFFTFLPEDNEPYHWGGY